MIKRLEITGVHLGMDDDIKKYVVEKIGRLDKYVSRHTRESLRADVKLKEGKAKTKQTHTCEVILYLPQEKFTIKETDQDIKEAIDLAEEKLKIHLKKYKELHTSPKLRHRVAARFKREQNPLA